MTSELKIKRLATTDPDFDGQLAHLLAWDDAEDHAVQTTVTGILRDVKTRGDEAVLEYTQRFDQVEASRLADLEISRERLQQALERIDSRQREALEKAAQRIRTYHEKQLGTSWTYQEADGTVLGQQVRAMDRVGLYVPGGKAAYPSSVLMNAIPAKVAGVGEVTMVVPTPRGEVNDLVLSATAIAGRSEERRVGKECSSRWAVEQWSE